MGKRKDFHVNSDCLHNSMSSCPKLHNLRQGRMGVAEPVKSTEVPGVGHKGQAQVIEFCRFLAMKLWKSLQIYMES